MTYPTAAGCTKERAAATPISFSRSSLSYRLRATATATSPRVRSADPTVCNPAMLEPPRYIPSRPLASPGEEVVPVPLPHAFALSQHYHPVGYPFDLGEVVADEDHREPEPGVQIRYESLYRASRPLVQGTRRLVEQERLRPEGERAGYGDALLLPDRKRLRISSLKRGAQSHHLQQPCRFSVLAGEACAVKDRLRYRAPEEGRNLENHPDPPPQLQRIEPTRRLPVQVDLAGGRLDEAVDGAQQGTLARPRRTHDRRSFP